MLVSLTESVEEDQPFKRSTKLTGYLYPAPDNPLTLPSERLQLEPEADDTERSLQAEESGTNFVRANPISVSTPGTLNIIQEIQIRSTQAPKRKLSGKLRVSPSQRPRVAKQQENPSLRFSDNPLVAVLGRQVQGEPVEGFPNGLPELTPLGVRITLENMIGNIRLILLLLTR